MTSASIANPPQIRWAALAPGAAAMFAALACAIPILAHPYLPLVDLPNHVARLHVAASDLSQGPLAAYYDYSLKWTPNAAADLAWHFFGHPGHATRFAQVLMASYAVNLIAAAMVLGRVLHGRWTAWPAAAGMLAYSAPFLWGFQNFVLSLPFVLYGLALWIGTEGRSDLLRITLMVPFAIVVYSMHFFGFGILAIALLGREVQVALTASGAPVRRFCHLALRMTPFALPVAWLTWEIISGPPSPVPSITAYGTLWHALNGVVSPFFSFVLGGKLLNGMGALGVLILSIVLLVGLLHRRQDVVTLDPRLIGPVIALALAALFAPFWLNGVAWVQIRVPVALALVLVVGVRIGPMAPRLAGLLAFAVGVVILGRGIALERHAATHSIDVADLVAVAESLPAGARVLALREPGLTVNSRFSHAQAYLVVNYDVFVPTLFQGVHMLRVRDRWADHAHWAAGAMDARFVLAPAPDLPVLEFLRDWEEKYTHVIMIGTMPDGLEYDPRLVPVAHRGRMSLWSVAS